MLKKFLVLTLQVYIVYMNPPYTPSSVILDFYRSQINQNNQQQDNFKLVQVDFQMTFMALIQNVEQQAISSATCNNQIHDIWNINSNTIRTFIQQVLSTVSESSDLYKVQQSGNQNLQIEIKGDFFKNYHQQISSSTQQELSLLRHLSQIYQSKQQQYNKQMMLKCEKIQNELQIKLVNQKTFQDEYQQNYRNLIETKRLVLVNRTVIQNNQINTNQDDQVLIQKIQNNSKKQIERRFRQDQNNQNAIQNNQVTNQQKVVQFQSYKQNAQPTYAQVLSIGLNNNGLKQIQKNKQTQNQELNSQQKIIVNQAPQQQTQSTQQEIQMPLAENNQKEVSNDIVQQPQDLNSDKKRGKKNKKAQTPRNINQGDNLLRGQEQTPQNKNNNQTKIQKASSTHFILLV